MILKCSSPLSLFFFKVSIICSHFYSPIVISMVGGLMTVECFWSISMYCMVFISGTEPFILANNLQQLFARIVVKTWERERELYCCKHGKGGKKLNIHHYVLANNDSLRSFPSLPGF